MTQAIIGFAGVVVVSLMVILYQVVVERRDRGKKARYLAVRVVCILDDFIDECQAVMYNADYNLSLRFDEIQLGLVDFGVPMPTGLILPDDLDWTSIDARFSYDVFSLVNRVAIYARDVQSIHASIDDGGDIGSVFHARRERCQELQTLANDIVDRMRRRWELPVSARSHERIADI